MDIMEFNPVTWFVCKLCMNLFPTCEKLKEHKLERHFEDCLKIKCIIFEEKLLEHVWVIPKNQNLDLSQVAPLRFQKYQRKNGKNGKSCKPLSSSNKQKHNLISSNIIPVASTESSLLPADCKSPKPASSPSPLAVLAGATAVKIEDDPATVETINQTNNGLPDPGDEIESLLTPEVSILITSPTILTNFSPTGRKIVEVQGHAPSKSKPLQVQSDIIDVAFPDSLVKQEFHEFEETAANSGFSINFDQDPFFHVSHFGATQSQSISQDQDTEHKRQLPNHRKQNLSQKIIPSSNSISAKVELISKPYKCQICPSSFHHQDGLQKHMRSHSRKRPFKCQVARCPMTFTAKSSLTIHTRVVHGEELGLEQFFCPIPHCGRIFGLQSVLQRHIFLSHTNHKPFKCGHDGCSRTFKQKWHKNDHMRVCKWQAKQHL